MRSNDLQRLFHSFPISFALYVLPNNDSASREIWQKHRTSMSLAFGESLAESAARSTICVANRLFKTWARDSNREIVIDLYNHMQHLTFDILALVSFGKDFDTSSRAGTHHSLQSENESFRALENLLRIGKMVTKRFAPKWLWGTVDAWVCCLNELTDSLSVGIHDFQPMVDLFHTSISEALERKRSVFNGSCESMKAETDLLDRLLLGGVLYDEDIKDEALSVFTSGLDSTVSLICYAVYQICNNPHVAEKLIKEIGTSSDVRTF